MSSAAMTLGPLAIPSPWGVARQLAGIVGRAIGALVRQPVAARPVARPCVVTAPPKSADEQWDRLTGILAEARQRYERAEAAEARARTKLAAISYQINAMREELAAIRDLHPAIAPVHLPVVEIARTPARPAIAATSIAA